MVAFTKNTLSTSVPIFPSRTKQENKQSLPNDPSETAVSSFHAELGEVHVGMEAVQKHKGSHLVIDHSLWLQL